MNALTLRGIVAEELGSLRLHVIGKCGALGELRKTCWTRELPGFGTRHYVSGRKVNIVQARMEGRTRTVITSLKWSEVRGRRLLLTDSKTGPRTVWLAEAAATILPALPRREKQQYVFWNPATQRPITDIGNPWSKLRDEAGLPGVRIHDLRHSFASHAAAHSETLPMIGKLLGHADVRTTTRYAHLDDGHVIEAAQRIGDQIERSMSGSYSLSRNTKYDSGPLLHD